MDIVQILRSFALDMNKINSINTQYKSINRKELLNPTFIPPKNLSIQSNRFIPIEEDKLFWIFFVINYDMEEYNIMKRTFQKEKNSKFNIINTINAYMKDNKKKLIDKFKSYKISLPNMISDLGNSAHIVIDTFIGLCCFFNINIILIKNKCMMSYLFNTNEQNYYVIYYDKDISCRFSLVIDTKSKEQLNTYYEVSNLENPLKSISSYKKKDLQLIADKFGIHIKQSSFPLKDKTKQMLYTEIQQNI
jgi:hypothetical protein